VNPFERGEIGPDLFRAACRMRLKGVVSKNRPYQTGRSKHGLKVKNRKHPAMSRVMELRMTDTDGSPLLGYSNLPAPRMKRNG
jgi:ATP-dependent DNA ligase